MLFSSSLKPYFGIFYSSSNLRSNIAGFEDWQVPVSSGENRGSANETVNLDSIPVQVKPKTIKIGIHSFLA